MAVYHEDRSGGRRCDECGDFIDPIDWCPGCIKANGACLRPHRRARKRADARYCDDVCSDRARTGAAEALAEFGRD